MWWVGDAFSSQINATPEDEAGIGDELSIMGVREPGLRILTYEMSVKERCVRVRQLTQGKRCIAGEGCFP